jgi:hypothetical protein
MKILIFLSLLMSIKVYAEMSPEESTATDYVMIEQSLELRKRMSVSFFDDIVKIQNSKGSWYTVIRDRCLSIVEVSRVPVANPTPGGSYRIIKEIKGPYCFRK